ncbi:MULTISPECIES: peptidoglycan-binding protein [unclassified Marinovum]|uniref:peptidoglycan-binding protein n=1 Tax=unclassified Marinovum TaxID=2647166 RepID=UPI0026E3F109|nr:MULTISPECIES: peptidoglycan-binding protein [unclassified Marinovum]
MKLFACPAPWRRFWPSIAFATTVALAGCGPTIDKLAPVAAQPKTPVARNITNFSASLQCMDNLLAAKPRKRIRLSATPISDDTKRIYVGADDMLISAVNQMNRRSRAFVFLDQPLIREGSLYELQTVDPKRRDDAIWPHYYIRGSISQLDDGVRDLSYNGSYYADDTGSEDLSSVRPSGGRSNSVVSVDLHLVAYPSREVLPGASVSNSMVVTERGFGSGFTGRIAKGTLGLTLQIDSLESNGQAVRNLIELATIELLGRFSGVPYWECLSLDTTLARKNARKEYKHALSGEAASIREAQQHLLELGWLSTTPTGRLDSNTKHVLSQFQAKHGLIASGRPDFDTLAALRKAVAALNAPKKRKPKPKTVTVAPARTPDTSGYRNISEYIGGG